MVRWGERKCVLKGDWTPPSRITEVLKDKHFSEEGGGRLGITSSFMATYGFWSDKGGYFFSFFFQGKKEADGDMWVMRE